MYQRVRFSGSENSTEWPWRVAMVLKPIFPSATAWLPTQYAILQRR